MVQFDIRNRMEVEIVEVELSSPEIVVVGCLVLLGVAHSALGESGILRPLFAVEWATSTPRWALERILRFAWHLTSITWIALAAIVAGAPILAAVGWMSLVSAGVIFVMLRGHLAWPIFLLGGLAALRGDGALGDAALRVGAVVTAVGLIAAALVHVYWAAGGRWMFDRVAPTSADSSFRPGTVLTLMVAAALGGFAALVVAVTFAFGSPSLRWLVAAGVAVFALRAVGDTRLVGFTKQVRDTDFAVADDRYFTPIVVFLALGAFGAVVV